MTFASYWIDTVNWGYATTNSSLLRQSSARSCAECLRFAAIFDRVRRAGDHFRGGHLSASNYGLVAAGDDHGATRAVDVTYDQAAVDVLSGSGAVLQRAPQLVDEVRRIWLARAASSWTVVDTKEVVTR